MTRADSNEVRDEDGSVSERDSRFEENDSSDEGSGNWNQEAVFRLLGLGTELAGFTLVVAGLGYLLDTVIQFPKPYGTAFGALLGFALGMVRFIRQARQSDRR